MPRRKDLTGQTFGKLTVIEYAETRKGVAYWRCRCSCGGTKEASTSNLRSGGTTHCGCSHANKKHGGAGTPEYHIWEQLKKKKVTWPNAWDNFKNFIAAVGERPSDDCILTRRDNRQPYSKANTYWSPNHGRNHTIDTTEDREHPRYFIDMRALSGSTTTD